MGIMIQEVVYVNDRGDRIAIDFADTNIGYRNDKVEDLLREMVSGGKLGPKPKVDEEKQMRMGPPPRPEDGEGSQAAWGDGVLDF